MGTLFNKIAEVSNFIIISMMITVIFLFGGQTSSSSRLVRTEIS